MHLSWVSWVGWDSRHPPRALLRFSEPGMGQAVPPNSHQLSEVKWPHAQEEGMAYIHVTAGSGTGHPLPSGTYCPSVRGGSQQSLLIGTVSG